MKYLIRNGKELTKKEYVAYLEGMAEGIWRATNGGDDYSKMTDPLYIGSNLNDVYSYVFNFHDGGRHHCFKNLGEIYKALLKEVGA